MIIIEDQYLPKQIKKKRKKFKKKAQALSVYLDIPINQNIIIKQRFDWDLSLAHISPCSFIEELCTEIGIDSKHVEKLKYQLLTQLVEFYSNRNYIEEEEDHQDGNYNKKKSPRRLRRSEALRKYQSSTIYNPLQNKYFKQKKQCKNCKNQNITPGFQCKMCKLPFYLIDSLDLNNKRVALCARLYQKIASKIPFLVFEARSKLFTREDFSSFYGLFQKIRQLFQNSQSLSAQNIAQVSYIMQRNLQQFLNGKIDYEQKHTYSNQRKQVQENKPKRKRGRPRKLKIIWDQFLQKQQNKAQSSQYEQSISEQQEMEVSSQSQK